MIQSNFLALIKTIYKDPIITSPSHRLGCDLSLCSVCCHQFPLYLCLSLLSLYLAHFERTELHSYGVICYLLKRFVTSKMVGDREPKNIEILTKIVSVVMIYIFYLS